MAQRDACLLLVEVRHATLPSVGKNLLYRHICLLYDGAKDLYKIFVDGVKTESGSWAGDNPVEPVRSDLFSGLCNKL